MQHNPFKDFLNELAKALEFSHLEADTHGACLIVLKEDQLPLLFEFDDSLVPGTILASCEIAPIPQEIKPIFLEQALIANHTLEETLSICPNKDSLFLHRRIGAKILSDDLKVVIDSLVSQARQWRKKIKDIEETPHEERQESPEKLNIQKFKV